MNYLSLFDGSSGCRIAAQRCNLPINKYFASEVCVDAIKVSTHHFPDTIHVGDVRNLKAEDFIDVDIITGGSPCTNFSFMGKRQGMKTTSNIEVTTLKQYLKLKNEGFEFVGQSYLFWEFVRLYNEINELRIGVGKKPLLFFLENVRMNKKWEGIITKTLKTNVLKINSSLVSAQSRERLYWTNLPKPNIKDKGIKLETINPEALHGVGFRGRKIGGKWTYPMSSSYNFKSNCIVTDLGSKSKDGVYYGTGFYLTKNGNIERFTVEEAELLQGLPKGYTNVGISNTSRVKIIGNGWNIDTIEQFFKKLS